MPVRTLSRQKTAFRIGDPNGAYPIWSDGGAKIRGGRWHIAGDPVIYASEFYSTAMLEKLAWHSGVIPKNQYYIEITIPAGTSYEVFEPADVPDWRKYGSDASCRYGHRWAVEKRSAILFAPSAVAPMDMNVVFNTAHPDFSGIQDGLERRVFWDDRLFQLL